MTICMMVVKPFWDWVPGRRKVLDVLKDQFPDVHCRVPGRNPFTDVRPIRLSGQRPRVRLAVRSVCRELGVEYVSERP